MLLFKIIYVIWYVSTFIQSILSYGTAYRLTKKGGDNGIALFGWASILGFASLVPGLGLYLWIKYHDLTSD